MSIVSAAKCWEAECWNLKFSDFPHRKQGNEWNFLVQTAWRRLIFVAREFSSFSHHLFPRENFHEKNASCHVLLMQITTTTAATVQRFSHSCSRKRFLNGGEMKIKWSVHFRTFYVSLEAIWMRVIIISIEGLLECDKWVKRKPTPSLRYFWTLWFLKYLIPAFKNIHERFGNKTRL